eukprot:6250615-Amphidinium_carterae.1
MQSSSSLAAAQSPPRRFMESPTECPTQQEHLPHLPAITDKCFSAATPPAELPSQQLLRCGLPPATCIYSVSQQNQGEQQAGDDASKPKAVPNVPTTLWQAPCKPLWDTKL